PPASICSVADVGLRSSGRGRAPRPSVEGAGMNRIGIALVCVASLCACSTTRVGMKYDSSRVQEVFAGQTGTISVGSFIDQRGEPAHWLGAIRGGFGNPVKK